MLLFGLLLLKKWIRYLSFFFQVVNTSVLFVLGSKIGLSLNSGIDVVVCYINRDAMESLRAFPL